MKTERRPLLKASQHRQDEVNALRELDAHARNIERARVVIPANIPTTPNRRVNQTPVTPPATTATALFMAGFRFDVATGIWSAFGNPDDDGSSGLAAGGPGLSIYYGGDGLEYTTDAGASWGLLSGSDDFDTIDLAIAADGTGFRLISRFPDFVVQKSVGGAIWTDVYTDAPVGGYDTTAQGIQAHPTDSNRVVAYFSYRDGVTGNNYHHRAATTTNGGGSWTRGDIFVEIYDPITNAYLGETAPLAVGYHASSVLTAAFAITRASDANASLSVYSSSNDGALWTETYHVLGSSLRPSSEPYIFASGGHLGFVTIGIEAARFWDTTDGTTFTVIQDSFYEPFAGVVWLDGHQFLLLDDGPVNGTIYKDGTLISAPPDTPNPGASRLAKLQ